MRNCYRPYASDYPALEGHMQNFDYEAAFTALTIADARRGIALP